MLTWNEIRHRAIAFSRDWKGTTLEKSGHQTFWNEFFDIFGIKRRTVAAFEEPVRKLSGNCLFRVGTDFPCGVRVAVPRGDGFQ